MPYNNLLNLYLTCIKRLGCLLAGLLPMLYAGAQSPGYVTPSADDTILLTSSLDMLSSRFVTETAKLQGDNKKYTAGIYKERFNSLAEMFFKKEIVTLPEATAYLQSLGNEIIKNNRLLQPLAINFFFSKTAVPNAASWGEGVIVFNAGLFNKLDNESQAIFVLCHELAHLYLNHSNNSIDKYVNALYSKETQEQLKHIRKVEYNKRSQLEELLKGLSFDTRRHSRDHENEADSLGLVFMKNSGYDLDGALTCLALLDSVDNDNSNLPKLMSVQFNSSTVYPFKRKWIEKEPGLLGRSSDAEMDKKEADSLKTHPDCTARIAALKRQADEYKDANGKKAVLDKVEFLHLQQIFPYDAIGYYYDSRQYSLALFHALEMLEHKPQDAFVITVIGQTMNRIYEAEKQHRLARMVDVPSPDYPANYNTVLRFIQNLYPEELAQVNYYFLKQYQQQLSSYPQFNSALEESRKLADK